MLIKSVKTLGYDVLEANSGKTAWDIYKKENIPIIISDWLMPNINGLELCRRIRKEKRNKYTYFIMVTILEGKRNFLEAIEAGVDDFFSKPFDHDELVARLYVAERILNLQDEVALLSELLPICCYCRKVRDDQNYWDHVENFIERHWQATFSHSICPECYEKISKNQLKSLRLNES
jgi:DNA-binding response OmpR family regulator